MPDANATFDNLITRLLADYARLHPVEATRSGLHAYDDRLPDWSLTGIEARRHWAQSNRAALKAIPEAELDTNRRLDRQVALSQLALYDISDEWGYAQRAPALYVEQASNALHALLARPDTTASEAEREARLLSRLSAAPDLLEQGRAAIDPSLVAPEFAEIGRVAVRGAVGFVQGLSLPPQAEGTREAALQALAEYGRFVEELTPGGTFAIGPALFERLLREHHGLDLTPDGLYALGEQTAADLQARLESKAREIDSTQPWQAIVEGLKTDHPTRDGLLQAYRDEAARARAFVLDRRLITIPPGETCEIRPTPLFLRATAPLGFFDKVPPFTPTDNLGILYITEVDASLPAEQQDELLQAHCFTAVRAICFHETYPGHHYQFWWAKQRANPLRQQFYSMVFAEGWALYTEELMEEAGYFDTPALSLWQLKNAMWRAVRMTIDVGLHTGRLSLDAAAQLLVDRAGLEPNTARGEVLRYTTSPTQPSSYTLGRNRVVQLREQFRQRQGDAFSLLDFHTRLLDYSSVPPAFIPDGLG